MAGVKESKAAIDSSLKDPYFVSNKGRLARLRIGNITVVYNPRHNSIDKKTLQANEQEKGK